jgi:hypothetical protein
MSNKYNYEDRGLFEEMLKDAKYSEVTVQVYASALVNPKATAHTQAKKLWIKLMDGMPLPTWDKVLENSPNRPSGLSYNVGDRNQIELPEDEPSEDVPSNDESPVEESKPTTDLDFLRLVLSKADILNTVMEMPVDDDTKRKIITVLLEDK